MIDLNIDRAFCEVPNYGFELNVCLSVRLSDEKHFF